MEQNAILEAAKKFIQKAIKHPGDLHKQLGVPAGEKIPAKKLNAAAKEGGKLGKRARLAKTLKSFSEGKFNVPVEYGPTGSDVEHHQVVAATKKEAHAKAIKKHMKLHPGHSPSASMDAITKLNEAVFHVKDHMGNVHEVVAKDSSDAKKKIVSDHKIPMSQWSKVSVERSKSAPLSERKLTGPEMEKKEELVHKMKKSAPGFVRRYGDKAKEVMYATATKKAKELAEETSEYSTANDMHHHIYSDKSDSVVSGSIHTHHFKGPELVKVDRANFSHDISQGIGRSHIEKSNPHLNIHQAFALANHLYKHHKTPTFAAPSHMKEESVSQLDELKMPKYGFLDRHLFGITPKSTVKRVHDMSHNELLVLHKSHEKSPSAPGSPGAFQHKAITRELARRQSRGHETMDKSKFVKKSKSQLDELKMPKYDFTSHYILGYTPKSTVKRVHDMSHSELLALHKSHEKSPSEPGSPGAFQHKAIKKELERRKSPGHATMDRSKFVKKSIHESVREVIAEALTRKHFQQVADVIKAHPDADKRKELAHHHAEIFAKSNPRFDRKRFFTAANVQSE